MKKGLFVGLSTVDFDYLVASYPSEDSKITARDQITAAGGPAANAAVAFSFLADGGGHLVTALGHHWLTRVIRDDMHAHSVQITDLAPDSRTAPPASSIIVSEETASRTIVSLDATRTNVPAPAAPETLISHAEIVLVDGHLMAPSVAIAREARASGIPVVFDGGRWKETHLELLQHVDIAICSNRFAPPVNTKNVPNFLHDLGIENVAITNGNEPVEYWIAGSKNALVVPDISAIDTLGAGDIFHGAFCYFYLHGRDFSKALHDATAVAVASCEHFGTRAWMASGRARFIS